MFLNRQDAELRIFNNGRKMLNPGFTTGEVLILIFAFRLNKKNVDESLFCINCYFYPDRKF
jgi:hypothetical protein